MSMGSDSCKDDIIRSAFLEKAFWLCENYPGLCKRSYFGQWLVCCLRKTGDKTEELAAKRTAVKRILQYFELPQRAGFERELINFVNHFSLLAPMRFREISPRIENGTDWGRTYQKSLIETPGRMCSFVNYSRQMVLDYATRNSLVLLAWNIAKELRDFTSLIEEFDADTAHELLERARNLEVLRRDCKRLPEYYNFERTDYALRRTPEGRRIADDIISWVFTPEWNFKFDNKTRNHSAVSHLISDLQLNDNDLFEIVAIVTSIQILKEKMRFEVVGCDISDAKPVVTLRNGEIYCQVRKNFDDPSVEDKLKHYRTVGNDPSGFQPDIVYKFWKEGSGKPPVYLLGDAKNYGTSQHGRINYPIALFAMMHYLIAFHDALKIPGDLTGFLNGNMKNEYQRVVLFFSKPQYIKKKKNKFSLLSGEENKIRKDGTEYLQPGSEDDFGQRIWHPVLFVYGPNAQTDENENNQAALMNFFQTAINHFNNRSQ